MAGVDQANRHRVAGDGDDEGLGGPSVGFVRDADRRPEVDVDVQVELEGGIVAGPVQAVVVAVGEGRAHEVFVELRHRAQGVAAPVGVGEAAQGGFLLAGPRGVDGADGAVGAQVGVGVVGDVGQAGGLVDVAGAGVDAAVDADEF